MADSYGLYADPAMRLPYARPSREEADSVARSAALAMTSLLSHSFARLARFMGDGARVADLGRFTGHGSPAEALRGHLGRMSDAARAGIGDAVRAARRQGTATMQAVGQRGTAARAAGAYGVALGVDAARAFAVAAADRAAQMRLEQAGRHESRRLSKELAHLRRVAEVEATRLQEADAALARAILGRDEAAARAVVARREALRASLPQRNRRPGAFGTFAANERRLAAERNGEMMAPEVTAAVASLTDRIRMSAAMTTSNLFIGLRMVGQDIVEKAGRLRRFFSGSARTATVGSGSSPFARVALAVLAVGGLAAVGLGHSVVSAVDPATISAAAHGAAEAGRHFGGAASMAVTQAAHGAKVAMMGAVGWDSAIDAYRSLVTSASHMLGATEAGHGIVQATQAAVDPAAQTVAQAAQTAHDAAQAVQAPVAQAAQAAPVAPVAQAAAQTVQAARDAQLDELLRATHSLSSAAVKAAHHGAQVGAAGHVEAGHAATAADLLNAQELAYLSSPAAPLPAPGSDFIDAVRAHLGPALGGADAAQAALQQAVSDGEGVRQLAGNGGAAMVAVTAADNTSLVINPALGAYTLLDPAGRVLAEQIGPVAHAASATLRV